MSKRTRPDTICKNCGKAFYIPRHAKQIFCSHSCASEYNSKHPSPNLSNPKPKRKTGKFVTCLVCGKVVYKAKNQLDKTKYQFCSLACANIYQRRNKVLKICKTCGKQYYISASYEVHGTPKYCSLKCRDNDVDRYVHLLKMNQYNQRRNPSKLDESGYRLLDEIGCIYEMQYMIDDVICVDAFLPLQNLIIQFDGDYWHGNINKFPVADLRQSKRMAIDVKQNEYFLKKGYLILRIWESDLKHNRNAVKNKIALLCDK